jgi:hypothetical protein
MPYPYTSFLNIILNTYTLHVAVGVIISFALIMFIHRYEFLLSKVADVCLGAAVYSLPASNMSSFNGVTLANIATKSYASPLAV